MNNNPKFKKIMEENRKKCPYCGEDISVDAIKCLHCGEWLVDEKESDFGDEHQFNDVFVSVVMLAAMAGSFIQAIYYSGLYNSESPFILLTPFYLIAERIAGAVPGEIGDILFNGGEFILIYLLMVAMSHLHKPMTTVFCIYLFNIVFGYLLYYTTWFNFIYDIVDAQLFPYIWQIWWYGTEIILGTLIVMNYKGKIKRLGWIFIIYTVLCFFYDLLHDYTTTPPWLLFIFAFVTDCHFIKELATVYYIDDNNVTNENENGTENENENGIENETT